MSHIRNRIILLKRPAFFAYMAGFLFAAFGNGLGHIAISWIVITHHSNVTAMAILMICFWGPNIILSPLMGVLADRLSQKWIITLSHITRAVIFIAFSIYLTKHFNVLTVYFMIACVGTAFSAFYSSAFGFMRSLVPEKDLMYANSTLDIIYEVGNMLGMGSAGLLIAWTSQETAILINGIAFIIATLSMFFIPKKELVHGGGREKQTIKFMQDFRDGLLYLARHKKLIAIYIIQLLIFMTFLTAPLLLVPFSKVVLHASVAQFGVIEACASTGIIVGGILMPWLAEQCDLRRILLFFTIALCISFIFFGYNRSIDIAAVLYFIIGFAGAVWPLVITQAQALTDFNFQGRVQSTFNSLSGVMMLLFYVSMGWMGKYFAVNHLYWIEVMITLIALFFIARTKKWRE